MKFKFSISFLFIILTIINYCMAQEEPKEIQEQPPAENETQEHPTPDPNKDTTPDLVGESPAETVPDNSGVITDCDNLKLVLDNYPEYNKQLNVNFVEHTMNCCNNDEFICKEINGVQYITELNLGYKYLKGTIARSIGNFTMLERLDLRSNKLVGSIPEDFKFLTNLEYLDLSTNDLDGEFPQFIGEMSNLRVIDFSNNNLQGSLPDNMNKLYFLEKFTARYNLITGEISDFFASTPNLTILDLSLNKLQGKIPKNINKLVNITEIHLNNNELTGSLPDSFTELENLETLYLSFNKLKGRVPDMPSSLRTCSYRETSLCVKEDAICGVNNTPICKNDYKKIGLIIAAIIGGILIFALFIRLISKCRRRSRQPKARESDEILLVGEDEIMEENEFMELKKSNKRRAAEIDEDYLIRM